MKVRKQELGIDAVFLPEKNTALKKTPTVA